MKRLAVIIGVLLAAGFTVIACGDGDKGPSGPRVRIVLALTEAVDGGVPDDALEEIRAIIERRVEQVGLTGANVHRADGDRIAVELPQATLAGLDASIAQAGAAFGRRASLQFCEPVTNAAGDVAIVRQGTVQYQPQSCEPVRDEQGNIVVEGGVVEFAPWARSGTPQLADNPSSERIVWQPATAEVDGVEKALTGYYLRPNTFVFPDPVLRQPILQFEWTSEGQDISELVTQRLAERTYPLAPFLDGQRILDSNGLPIAPNVQSVIMTAAVIEGLSQEDAEELSVRLNTEGLSALLNMEAFPLSMQAVEVQEARE